MADGAGAMKRQELAATSSRASTTKVSRRGTDGDSVRTSISENGIVADADGAGGRGGVSDGIVVVRALIAFTL